MDFCNCNVPKNALFSILFYFILLVGKNTMLNLYNIIDFELLKNSAVLLDLTTQKKRDQTAIQLSKLFHMLLVEVVKPKYFMEIGAFNANFSTKLRPDLVGTKFFAFEANPYNFNKFKERVHFSGIEYLHTAISDHVGTVTFNLQKSVDGESVDPIRGNSSLLERNQDQVEYEKITVPCDTVDNRFAHILNDSDSVAMWVDVEGMAYEVFTAATQTLTRTKLILVELEDKDHWEGQKLACDVIELMYSKSFLPIARDFEWPYQHNVIFAHVDLLKNHLFRDAIAKYYTTLHKNKYGFNWRKLFNR